MDGSWYGYVQRVFCFSIDNDLLDAVLLLFGADHHCFFPKHHDLNALLVVDYSLIAIETFHLFERFIVGILIEESD